MAYSASAAVVDSTFIGGYPLVMDKREEDILVAQARDGCQQSFTTIVTQESPQLIRLAWRLLGNRADAEDIVQEAFLRLHRSLASFRGDSRIGTWLYRTVTRLSIDYLRRENIKRKIFFLRRDNNDPDPIDLVADPLSRQDDQLYAQQQVVLLRQAMNKLSPQQRTVLTLRHQEELPLKEIAEILNLSEGTIKVHLHRAVKSLRSTLAEKEKES